MAAILYAPPETEEINLLIVDDKPANLISMEAVLESPEYHIYTALSGTEALKRLLERDFALILLDIQMPGIDGFECAQLIKQSDRTKHIPIIFVTAIFKEEKYIFSGYSLGAVDYLLMPVDAKVLKAKVAVFVDLFRKNKALKALSEDLHLKAQIPDLAADSILVFDTRGQPVYANAAAYLSRGYNRDEFMQISLNQLVEPQYSGHLDRQIQVLREEGELRFITTHFRKDGGMIPVEVYSCIFVLDGREMILSVARDITERLKAEEALLKAHADLEERVKERTADLAQANQDLENEVGQRRRAEEVLQVSHRFLEIANRHNEMTPLLQEFVEEVQKTIQCQAVAIRVLDAQGNIPYQAYEGFSQEFYELESPLSIKSDECMCINVIKGTTDPQLPFYTPGGSFYMNATTRFLATVSEEDKGRTRNTCNEFGYESVALVPIRPRDHILGLIHVADPRENMVPLPRVEELEGIAQQLGAAMQRVSDKAALDKLNRQYELILSSAWEGIIGLDPNGNHTFVNPAAARMLGYEAGDLIGRQSHSIWHHTRPGGSPYPAEECPIHESLSKGGIHRMSEEQFWKKDGTSFPVEATSTPLKDNGAILGSVVTFWDITQRKEGEEALKNSLERLQRTLEGTVKALALTVETRDPYTAGHQVRVAQLAGAISQEMGFSQDQLEGMQVLSLLHDIGKIAVPAEILSKPGKLSETEFNLLKAHPQVGYDILKDAEFPWAIDQAVLQHHERMDGSGYPQGLTGPDITLCARILAVADVVEAMASHRPYRVALGIKAALEEISKNRGVLYDPEVVDACLKLFTEKNFTFGEKLQHG